MQQNKNTMNNKYLIALFALVALIACKNEKEEKIADYAKISGKIDNATESVINISGKTYNKTITLNDDGSFEDTLHIQDDFYMLQTGTAKTILMLQNGFDLNVSFDELDVLNTAKYTGKGSGTNNYMNAKMQLEQKYDLANLNAFFELEKTEFDSKINKITKDMNQLLENAQDLDSVFRDNEIMGNKKFINYLTEDYEVQSKLMTPIKAGQPSPTFNYPDVNGKNVSLNSLKGNYVYIDVWATWCGPCKKEVPFLKKLHADYKDKNLKIVSISIDKPENKEKWKNMVKEEQLTGIQIIADNEWNSEFLRNYNITGIPRFILIGPDGKIIDNNAPRPSDPKLKKLFNKLNI